MSKFVTTGLSVTATSGGASGNVLYTCPARFNGEITFFHISSGTSANKKITVEFYHAETTTYHKLLNALDMAASSSHEVGGAGAHIAMHPGDKIVCSTDTASNFDVLISVTETRRLET